MHTGHRDRLRKRFLDNGLENFEPHTALELLLFYARPRHDTNEIAHDLIKTFGSFSAVLEAPLCDLQKVHGVGRNTAVLLKLIPELSAFYMQDKTEPGVILNSTEKAGAYFLPKFIGKTNECLYMVSLDNKKEVVRCTKLEDGGTVNAVAISVKKIVTEALSANATAVILAHNHPGGIALPSSNDKWVTQQVYVALRMVDVQLIDHLIIADDDFVSLLDSGFIDLLKKEYP